MAETVEYDLPVLLQGTVTDIEPKLAGMETVVLVQLRALEVAEGNRKTLLASIDAELAGHAAAATALTGGGSNDGPATGPDAGDNGTGTPSDTPLSDPGVNDLSVDMQTLRQVMADVGYVVLEGENVVLCAASAIRELVHCAETARLAMIDGPSINANSAMPVTLSLDDLAEADSAFSIVFADAQDVRIDQLGRLAFGAAGFAEALADGSRLLTKKIEFPQGVEAAAVSSVWLVDGDGDAWSVCRLLCPLPVGGGRSSAIPAGFLSFAPPVKAQPIAEAA